jgi:hypothetical protein
MKIRSRQLTEREELLICRALRSWEAGDTTEDKQKEALVEQIANGELLLIMRRDG